jgi:hypothetical protein
MPLGVFMSSWICACVSALLYSLTSSRSAFTGKAGPARHSSCQCSCTGVWCWRHGGVQATAWTDCHHGTIHVNGHARAREHSGQMIPLVGGHCTCRWQIDWLGCSSFPCWCHTPWTCPRRTGRVAHEENSGVVAYGEISKLHFKLNIII